MSFILLVFTSCNSASKAVSCKHKPIKHKKYRVKKNKRSKRAYAYGGGGTSSSASKSKSSSPISKPKQSPAPVQTAKLPVKEEQPIASKQEQPIPQKVDEPKPAPEPQPVEERQSEQPKEPEPKLPEPKEEEPEEEILTIAESKVGGLPIPKKSLEEKIEELKSDEEFSFDEQIQFIDLSDLFADRSQAIIQINELARLLRKNPDVEVTIIGNTATESPNGEAIYGDGVAARSQSAELNGKDVTIYDVMLARANRVKQLLGSKGVNGRQMKVKPGSHRQYEKDRVVTFILKRK